MKRPYFVIVPFRALRNKTFARFVADILPYLDQFNLSEFGLGAAIEKLKQSNAMMLPALDMIFKSGVTAKLKRQDRLRDGLVYGIMLVIQAFRHHPDSAKNEASRLLMILFEHYRGFSRKVYDDESAAMSDLTRELSEPVYAACVSELDLGALAAHLIQANEVFITLTRERYQEVSQRPGIKMAEAREIVMQDLRELVALAEAVATFKGPDCSPAFAGFRKAYNTVATRYKHNLAVQKGRHEAATEEDTEEANVHD
ncbi:MAG: DUF6261 family protein [Odoribacteraceae bacterium]|jgi:hypothetical protein|nr:DUF6261 family protein [Odoribacteraceae bacterium]